MYINNEDLEQLIKIEAFLYDAEEKELFSILYNMIEKLKKQKKETNQKVCERIAEKRKTNKNYARPKNK